MIQQRTFQRQVSYGRKNEQQESPVPEVIMQKMETGLTSLKHANERMQQDLQTHCQLLGLGEEMLADMEMQIRSGQGEAEDMKAEINHLQSAIEQRAVDFQRLQEEYETLLVEYRRIFENS